MGYYWRISSLTLKSETEKVVGINQKILEYYESSDFLKIKDTCEVLMSTQREFNEYITEKVQYYLPALWYKSGSK